MVRACDAGAGASDALAMLLADGSDMSAPAGTALGGAEAAAACASASEIARLPTWSPATYTTPGPSDEGRAMCQVADPPAHREVHREPGWRRRPRNKIDLVIYATEEGEAGKELGGTGKKKKKNHHFCAILES